MCNVSTDGDPLTSSFVRSTQNAHVRARYGHNVMNEDLNLPQEGSAQITLCDGTKLLVKAGVPLHLGRQHHSSLSARISRYCPFSFRNLY